MIRSLVTFTLLACALPAMAQDAEAGLAIRNHRFEPAELRVPAGKKIRITLQNHDTTAEEFESHELNREKLVPAQGKVVIYVGPLAAGRYPFFGEFNPKTAVGAIIAE